MALRDELGRCAARLARAPVNAVSVLLLLGRAVLRWFAWAMAFAIIPLAVCVERHNGGRSHDGPLRLALLLGCVVAAGFALDVLRWGLRLVLASMRRVGQNAR